MNKNEKEYLLQRKKWLSSIRNLSNNLKFDLAKREIIKYLSEYPYDEYAVVEYLKILIRIGMFMVSADGEVH